MMPNPNLLRLLLKKIAECVCQPVSYHRLSQVLSLLTRRHRANTQVCYGLTQKEDTYDEREVGALSRLPKVLPCRRRVILTYDEEQTITDQHGAIDVLPLWRWEGE